MSINIVLECHRCKSVQYIPLTNVSIDNYRQLKEDTVSIPHGWDIVESGNVYCPICREWLNH